MAAPINRMVGWYSRSEWNHVYQELFSNSTSQQQHAVDRIAVWKCRVLHKLSPAIESTANLVSASLQDKRASRNGTVHQDNCTLRMNYSMALVRFVNLLTEKGQTKQYATPIHILAKELGIPEWVVNMRHGATHSALPSLSVLRTATQFALSWLQQEYWEPQSGDSETDQQEASESEKESNSKEKSFHQLLLQYQKEQLTVINGDKKGSNDNALKILSKLEKLMTKLKDGCVPILLMEGNLIPHKKQRKEYEDYSMQVPERMLALWKPFLRLFQRMNLLPPLLQSLVSKISEHGSQLDRLLMCWTISIANALCNTEEDIRDEALFPHSSDIDWRRILDTALRNPNKYTCAFIESLIPYVQPALSKSQKDKLCQLVDLYTKTAAIDDAEYEIHTLADIREAADSIFPPDVEMLGEDATPFMAGLPCSNGQHKAAWELSTAAVDWSRIPLGGCPDDSVDYTNLEIISGSFLCHQAREGHMSPHSPHSLETEESGQQTYKNEDQIWTSENLAHIQSRIEIF